MKRYSEKRISRRTQFRQPIVFEMIVHHADLLENSELTGRGIDVSSGGIGLASPCPMTKGEVVKVSFPVNEGRMRVPVFTEVMWTVSAGGQWRAGLRFLG